MNETYLCLSELLDQDLTSFEYYQTLPQPVRQALEQEEVHTFEELQAHAKNIARLQKEAESASLQGRRVTDE